jgi:hypothetical protein
MRRLLPLPILGFALLVACSGDDGEEENQDPPPATVSYEFDIQPLFTSECIHCHGGAGGLDLQDYEGLMAGGNSGAVVVAGDPDASLLIDRLDGTILPTMPADGPPLTGPEIGRIEQWILEGALDN